MEDYPGYSNKRGEGDRCDQPFPLGECSTFKFRSSHTDKQIYGVINNSDSALKRSRQIQGNPMEIWKRQKITFDRGIPQTTFSMNSKDFSDYRLTPLAVDITMEDASHSFGTCGRGFEQLC